MKKNKKRRYRLSDNLALSIGCEINKSKRYRLTKEQEDKLLEIKEDNTFEDALDDNNFMPNDNWSHGWLKTKEASIFIRNEQKQVSVDDIKETIIEAVREATNGLEWDASKGNPITGNLFVPNIFDLHLGKLAWAEETGEDYDVKIAAKRFRVALEDLIQKASGYQIQYILFPIGNDFFNSDRSKPFPSTTNGTPQADDGRWQRFFRLGIQLITEAVIRLGKIAPVKVVTVFSNHDHERVFYLGETINAVFSGKEGYLVDNSPKVRKYFQWGECLIGLAHGHNEKAQDLPLIMAQEAKQQWSETTYREWLLGHYHSKQKYMTQNSYDYKGVRVTYLTSPSSADVWHYEKGYVGAVKGAEAYIYNKEEGLIGSVSHNIK
jgi:hypothetical protein